jgi:hypothetical protein
VAGAFLLESLAAASGVAGYVVGNVDGGRLGFRGQADYLGGGAAWADYQVAAAGAQGLAEVGQGFGQEAGAVRRRLEGGVEDEQRDHIPGAGGCQVQGRIVV